MESTDETPAGATFSHGYAVVVARSSEAARHTMRSEARRRAGKSVLAVSLSGGQSRNASRIGEIRRRSVAPNRDDGVVREEHAQHRRRARVADDEDETSSRSRKTSYGIRESSGVLTSAGLLIPLMSHLASADALSFSVTFSTATSLFSLVLMLLQFGVTTCASIIQIGPLRDSN